jgi:hypothetical protein
MTLARDLKDSLQPKNQQNSAPPLNFPLDFSSQTQVEESENNLEG